MPRKVPPYYAYDVTMFRHLSHETFIWEVHLFLILNIWLSVTLSMPAC